MHKQKTTTSTIYKTPKNNLQSSDSLVVQDKLNHKHTIEDLCERIMFIYGQERWIEIIRYHFFQEINIIRKQYGLQPLPQNKILNTTAQKYAKYMFDNDWYEHHSKEWVTFDQRLNKAWYSSDLMAENIDEWFTSISKTIFDRLHEPWHKDVLLHKRIDEIGVGFYGWEMNRWNFSEWVGFFVMDVGKKQ